MHQLKETSKNGASAVLWGLIGLAIGTVTGMWFPPDVLVVPDDCSKSAVWCFLFTWQPLIAGTFALVGAAFLWMQIQDHRLIQKQELDRRLVKSRIQLPHALSGIHKYLVQCSRAWTERELSTRPDQPIDALNIVMEASVIADTTTFKSMRELVVHAQAFEARMDDEPDRILNFYSQVLFDLVLYMFLKNRLYEYGRFKKEVIPLEYITKDKFLNILKVDFGIDQEFCGVGLKKLIDEAIKYNFPE